ncbi:MAG: CoB--CoM heterodisulfide reductase iron-sulfur subunit B family protein [Acidobacteriia bacterium]|nr:CoB--CoM heterodisulfide reductase iron-sulfur subunit B family protein [Terriglobia bacterium]
MAYTYFPGCCMHGFARHCQDSLYAVFDALGLELRELPEWNCCGATTYISVEENQAFALGARNLAMAEKLGSEIVAPCTACYMILKKTKDHLARYPDLREKIDQALAAIGLHYEGKIEILHPLEIILRDVGVKGLKAKVKKPLRGWNVAPYYGCLIARPYALSEGFTLEAFDQLVPALGANLVDFELKARCCGGSLTGTIEEVGHRLVYILLHQAKLARAHCLVTVCPLCQLNLEAHQGKIKRRYGDDVTIPIPYFTQLIGMALGLSEKALGLEKLLVPLRWELAEKAFAAREPAAA